MKKVFLLIVVPALLVAMGFAQAPAASSNADPMNVKGCVGGSDGNYTVLENNTGKTFKITTSSTDLKAFVGQDVNLTGHKEGTAEDSLAVTALNMISVHCRRQRLHRLQLPAHLQRRSAHLLLRRRQLLRLHPLRLSARRQKQSTHPLLPRHLPLRHRMRLSARLRKRLSNVLLRQHLPMHLTRLRPLRLLTHPKNRSAHLLLPPLHRLRLSARRRRLPAHPLRRPPFTELDRQHNRGNRHATPVAAPAPAEPVSKPVADAAVPTAPVGPPPETANTSVAPAVPAAAATTASTSKSAGMIVSIVVVVLLIGAGVPLYNRWKRQKLLNETSGQNLSFTKEAKSDPGKSDTTGGRKAA